MMQVLSRARRALRLGGPLLVLALSFSACGGGSSLDSSEGPLPPSDSTPQDTITPPPTDTTTPPPDTTTPPPPPPPDTTTPPPPSAHCSVSGGGSSDAPVHVGLAFGPGHTPPERFGTQHSGTIHTGTEANCLMAELAVARRTNTRIFINFTGNERNLRDANGFNINIWKQRVDRFRHLNLTPYIQDGTILAHFIMDEPADPSNWSGKLVTHGQIEEMARYSKEIWPTMPTMIRTWPEYLKGTNWKDLDAVRFQYLERFGSLDAFMDKHFRDAEELGLTVVGGLNALNGGGPSSGIPGQAEGKHGMNGDELRSWGGKFMDRPNMCAFILWEYEEEYLARPEIRAALDDLAAKARNYPKKSCAK